MTARLRADLEAAFGAMESTFHVVLIATFDPDVAYAPAHVKAAAWLSANHPEYDQFPVKEDGRTVGILTRVGHHGSGLVRDTMLPLREGLLVSANTPIAHLIAQLRERPYRLVLRGGCIDGLVTQSDLLKLPVRLVAFALISQLEQVMAELIAARWREDSWLRDLSPGRQRSLRRKQSELKRRKMDPPLLELTEFCDKRDLCRKLLADGKAKFVRQLKALGTLRDRLSHSASILGPGANPSAVADFANELDNARSWIERLSKMAEMQRAQS